MASEKILVVDDYEDNLKLIRIVLSKEGYEVQTSGSAEDALRSVNKFRPDLILTDIQMPGMDGLELTRRLKADGETRHLPVVALTAYSMKGDQEKFMAAGCDGYIPKPINIPTFASEVRRFLPAQEEDRKVG